MNAATAWTGRVYAFHGLRVGCSADDAIATALDARLGRFRADGAEGRCDVAFEWRTGAAAAAALAAPRPEGARPIYDAAEGEVLYHDASDRLTLTFPDAARVDCDPGAGRTVIASPEVTDARVWLLAHPLFTLPFIETLKRRGLYSIHAAGVAAGGKVILFPGTSGSGKSTLALALLREGFDLLGDDMLFLARRPEGLRALAFPEALDVTEGTLRLFPELRDVLEGPPRPGWPKRQVWADVRYGSAVAWEGRPVALVFPRVVRAARSVLAPLDPAEALHELVPNILLTEAASSQAHLDAMAALAESCGCWRLETGMDFAELAGRLRALLEARP